jgi:hypothetical protein
MTIPGLTESTIRQQATAESFRRGQDYDRQGAVVSLVQRGNALEAEVEGSQYEPYRVHIAFDQAGITAPSCQSRSWSHCSGISTVTTFSMPAPSFPRCRSAGTSPPVTLVPLYCRSPDPSTTLMPSCLMQEKCGILVRGRLTGPQRVIRY